MESLRTSYDNIFFNQDRICKLIDDYNQFSRLKLEALGELIQGYVICRGRNIPGTSPMSISIIINKTYEPRVLESVLNELAEKELPAAIQNHNGKAYISLY